MLSSFEGNVVINIDWVFHFLSRKGMKTKKRVKENARERLREQRKPTSNKEETRNKKINQTDLAYG